MTPCLFYQYAPNWKTDKSAALIKQVFQSLRNTWEDNSHTWVHAYRLKISPHHSLGLAISKKLKQRDNIPYRLGRSRVLKSALQADLLSSPRNSSVVTPQNGESLKNSRDTQHPWRASNKLRGEKKREEAFYKVRLKLHEVKAQHFAGNSTRPKRNMIGCLLS